MATVFAVATAAFWVATPLGGDFWWFDSPSHGMNAVMVADFLRHGEWSAPFSWAISYYQQYPAISLGLYPPLLYLIMAPVIMVFGASHEAAQAVITISAFALSAGTYAVSRFWLPAPAAIAAGLIILAMPENALWLRQVQPEMPAFAFAVWSCWGLFAYFRTGRHLHLAIGVCCLLAAIYTRFTLIFVAVPFFTAFLTHVRGRITDRALITSATLFAILLIPAVLQSFFLGRMNLDQSIAAPGSPVGVDAWLYYAKALPEQAGVPVLIMAAIGAIFFLYERRWSPADAVFLLTWICVGYVFFSAVALKSPRFTIYLLLPVAILAASSFLALRQWFLASSIFVAAAILSLTFWLHPVPRVEGYPAVVSEAVNRLPSDGRVLLLVHRSAQFIFNLRAQNPSRDLGVVRAEKMLIRYRVDVSFGAEERLKDCAAVVAALDRVLHDLAVVQAGYLSNYASVSCFRGYLESAAYELVGRYPLIETAAATKGELHIYRRVKPIEPREGPDEVDIPMIGRSFKVR